MSDQPFTSGFNEERSFKTEEERNSYDQGFGFGLGCGALSVVAVNAIVTLACIGVNAWLKSRQQG